MIPADSDDIRRDYEILLKELREFNPDLADKKQGARNKQVGHARR